MKCGQEVYKSVVSSFYRGAAAVFLVYAVNNRQSFINMNNWYENFKSQGSPYALIFLIGTKIDLGR
jgi:GTPase SAR1 family protein